MIRSKTKISIIFCIGIVLCALCLGLCVIFSSARTNAYAEDGWTDVNFGETEINDKFSVPDRKVTIDGREYTCKKNIILPNGESYTEDEDGKLTVTLNQVGEYVVTYYVEVDGKTSAKEESFFVSKKMLSKGENTQITYGKPSHAKETSAMIIKLAKNETVEFNQYFDFSKMVDDSPMMEFYFNPSSLGSVDLNSFWLEFTDSIDSSVTLKINIKYTRINLTAVTVAGNGQPLTGLEGTDNYHRNDEWGAYTYCSMASIFNGNPCDSDSARLNLCFNNKEKTLKMFDTKEWTWNPNLKMVADLDSKSFFPDGLWKGFPSGKAYLKMYGTSWASNSAEICFTKILGYTDEDLENCLDFSLTDKDAPELDIELPEKMPEGRKGYTYIVPNATAVDIYDGKCNVDIAVTYEDKVNIGVLNGKFRTDYVGTYYITYTAKDLSKNVAQKKIAVHCGNNIEELAIVLPYSSTTANCGERVEIPTPSRIVGGSGERNYTVTVYDVNGVPYNYEEEFYPQSSGNWVIEYKATDYTGYSVTSYLVVSVEIGERAVLVGEDTLPKYFINGAKYSFDKIYANDYSSGKLVRKDINVKATDANGEKTYAVGQEYIPTVTENLKEVELDFIVEGYTIKSVNIPVIMAYEDSKLMVENYFVSNVGEFATRKTVSGIELSAQGNYGFIFAKDISINNFELVTGGTVDGGNFSLITYTVADYENSGIAISFSIKRNNKTFYFVYGGTNYELVTDLNKAENLSVRYENGKLICENNRVDITEYTNGKKFNGFSSSTVYLTAKVEASGDTKIKIVSINGHQFNRASSDQFAPNTVINGKYGGNYSLNEYYTLCTAFASDVLDPNGNILLTVTDPDGEVVTATDGTRLTNASCLKEYKIKLEKYGQYFVNYKVFDSNNTADTPYAINVLDEEAPTINFVRGFRLKANVGENYYIPTYTLTDNLSNPEDITCYVYVKTALGYMIEVNSNIFQLANAGEYEIYFYVYDEAHNCTVVSVKINVI